MTHHIDLSTIRLASGSHSQAEAATGTACLLEWSSIFAGVDYGDQPSCTSPVLGAFGRSFNDGLDDERRQRLVPFIPRLVGTAGDPEADEVRAWMATDWLVRVFTPTWLRKAGLTARADEIAALPALTSTELANAALPIIRKAKEEASAARDAASYAAGAAAWDAASYAAGAAARDAASYAAGAAAWAAARDAAGAAAGAAASYAASKTKGDYVRKYDAAYAAAKPLVDEALRETTNELFESALVLFGAMCDVRSEVPA